MVEGKEYDTEKDQCSHHGVRFVSLTRVGAQLVAEEGPEAKQDQTLEEEQEDGGEARQAR